jgi:hypothetical protein
VIDVRACDEPIHVGVSSKSQSRPARPGRNGMNNPTTIRRMRRGMATQDALDLRQEIAQIIGRKRPESLLDSLPKASDIPVVFYH